MNSDIDIRQRIIYIGTGGGSPASQVTDRRSIGGVSESVTGPQ